MRRSAPWRVRIAKTSELYRSCAGHALLTVPDSPPAMVASAMPTSRPPVDRRIENLERLAALLADGVLSRTEFEREKRRILGDHADPDPGAPAAREGVRTVMRRPLVEPRLGWFLLGLALLALVGWITFTGADPSAEPVPAAPPVEPASAGAIAPEALAGGWADERTGCKLGERDGFRYLGADGRYGGWGGFGGSTEEGRWTLRGTSLIATVTDRTDNNELRVPQPLARLQDRTFAVALPAKDHMTLTDAAGTVSRLVRCPDAHFEFSARR